MIVGCESVISLSQAVNNRITITTDSHNMYRIRIPRWENQVLVTASFRALGTYLSAEKTHLLRSLLIELHQINQGYIWHEFANVVLYVISKYKQTIMPELQINMQTTATTTNATGTATVPTVSSNHTNNSSNASQNLWEQFLLSDIYQKTCNKDANVLSYLNLENKNNFSFSTNQRPENAQKNVKNKHNLIDAKLFKLIESIGHV